MVFRYGPGRQSRQQSLVRLNQLQQSILGWEGKGGFISRPQNLVKLSLFSLTCIPLGLFSFDFTEQFFLLEFAVKHYFVAYKFFCFS